MRYFGRVDLVDNNYAMLLRLDEKKYVGELYVPADDAWTKSESAYEAPYDTTHYDELTKDEAIELKENMRKNAQKSEEGSGDV